MVDRIAAQFEAEAGEACREIAQFIAERANFHAPTRDPEKRDYRPHEPSEGPELKGSYYAEPSPETGEWQVLTHQPEYWRFVEFGTRQHGGPQPHVRPAIAEAEARFG